MITCDELVNNTANSVSTNVTSTVQKNFYNTKVGYKMDCYNLLTVF